MCLPAYAAFISFKESLIIELQEVFADPVRMQEFFFILSRREIPQIACYDA